jgi:hypothetical protein
MLFKKLSILYYKILANIWYHFGVLMYSYTSSDQKLIDDIWLISFHYDLKSGSKIWVEYARCEDGKIWQSLKDKDETIFVLESSKKGFRSLG